MNEQLKYPVGKYVADRNPRKEVLAKWIATIEAFPAALDELVKDVPTEKLNWCYRPGGWTVKEVIHHCADSHMNSMMRFKLTLTEDTPTVRPYFEDRWATLHDSQSDDISASLLLLKGLHKKWALLLKSLTEEELQREFMHPEHGKKFNLAETIGMYAWHCNQHFAHVKNGIESGGKYNS